MKEIIISAKTVDEAITKGCAELGVAMDEVDFEIVDEGGVFRKMQVKLTVKNTDSAETVATETATEAQPVEEKVVEEQPAEPVVQVQKGKVEEFEIGGQAKKERPAKAPRKVTEFDPNCPKFTKTLAFAEKFFKLMGDNLKVTTSHDDQEFIIAVEGDDVSRLIGKNGHTMTAINSIIHAIAINTHTDEPRRVSVDIGNYRAKRKEYLIDLAKRKAEQVKETGRSVRLKPMPARERVIVHLTLQDVEGIITESEGTEPQRYLVIKPGAR